MASGTRAAFVESIEDRVITLTPEERRRFEEVFARPWGPAMMGRAI